MFSGMFVEQLYGNKEFIEERHRHRYEVNRDYAERLETAGLKFVGELTLAVRCRCFLFKSQALFDLSNRYLKLMKKGKAVHLKTSSTADGQTYKNTQTRYSSRFQKYCFLHQICRFFHLLAALLDMGMLLSFPS